MVKPARIIFGFWTKGLLFRIKFIAKEPSSDYVFILEFIMYFRFYSFFKYDIPFRQNNINESLNKPRYNSLISHTSIPQRPHNPIPLSL